MIKELSPSERASLELGLHQSSIRLSLADICDEFGTEPSLLHLRVELRRVADSMRFSEQVRSYALEILEFLPRFLDTTTDEREELREFAMKELMSRVKRLVEIEE